MVKITTYAHLGPMWTRIWSFFTIFDAKIGFYGVTNLKIYTDIQSFYSIDQKTVVTKTRPVIGTSRVLSSRGRMHWAGALEGSGQDPLGKDSKAPPCFRGLIQCSTCQKRPKKLIKMHIIGDKCSIPGPKWPLFGI